MILPPRPYQVRSGFTVESWLGLIALVLLAVAAAPFVVRWRLAAARGLLEEKRIWEEGVPASDARGDWRVQKGVIFDDYELDLRYSDGSGATHRAKTELTTIRALDMSAAVELRYLRDHPDQIAISAAIERIGDRWIAWYAGTAFPAAITLGLVFLAARRLRRWLDVRHAGDRSDEVELIIDNIERVTVGGLDHRVHPTKRFRYHCHLPLEGGQIVRCEAVFNSALGQYPLFTNEEQSRLAALVSPHAPRRPVIVRNDMFPYRLDPQQVKTMKARLGIKD